MRKVKIRVARTIGFCMGVKRALFQTLAIARKREGKLYTWGPLIHNPQIIEVLAERGVEVLREMPACINGTVIIRAHGVAPAVRCELVARARRVCDATCPDVMKVQSIVKRHSRQGYFTVIVGDRGHAEVEGLMGFAGERCVVVNSPADVGRLPPMEKVCVVAQTTQDERLYEEVYAALKKRYSPCRVFQTICKSTRDKQGELREIAKSVDALVVVGGRGSANTARLADIARSCGVRTFHVESEGDLDEEEICAFERVGVVSGSSTPNWMIFRVIDRLEEIGRRRACRVARWGRDTLRFAVKSNLYAAAGAGFLACGASMIMSIPLALSHVLGSSMYVLAMHILNHFTDREALQFSEPAMMRFCEQRRGLLAPLGVVMLVAVMALGAFGGLLPFIFMGVACFLGIAYSIPMIPIWRRGAVGMGRIRDIPASKDIFVPAAWTAVIVVLPAIDGGRVMSPPAGIAGAYVFGLVFSRCLLFSVKDMQGDMIVGRETIPTLLGRGKSMLIAVAALLASTMVILASLPLIGMHAALLALPPLYLLVCAYACCFRAGRVPRGTLFEMLTDASFIVAGLSALFWKWGFSGA